MKRQAGERNDTRSRPLVIGVDFDNTIAEYGDLMHDIAAGRGLIPPKFPRSKKLIRDAIRALPDGESLWRGVQVSAYGPKMREARLIGGVREFFVEVRRRGVPVYIVSHKTEFANFGEASVNLRDAAMDWLEREGFFDESGIGLMREQVFFESTRAEKISRAKALGVTHFIDDLEETFGERSFPEGVAKILLAPDGEPTALSDVVSFRGWREIREMVLGGLDLEVLERLIGSSVRAVARIGRGGNSKVYRVTCANRRVYAAKLYFQRTMDGLDRLDVEFTSLQFLWDNGERATPRPIALNREAQVAVYEFVEGCPIDSAAAGDDDVGQAVRFARRLKGLASLEEAERLPRAAEACFSFAELAQNIDGRLQRLESAVGDGVSYSGLREFLRGELRPEFESVVRRTQQMVGSSGWVAELPKAHRTLSPSDFGFHNAVRRPNGDLVFLDLEYFGWDDTAKLIADFLLHPAMQLTDSARRSYVTGMLDCFSVDAQLPERLTLTYPLLAIKWCAILLNEFVPDFLARREFAVRATADREDVRLRQLAKARRMLLLAKLGLPAAAAPAAASWTP